MKNDLSKVLRAEAAAIRDNEDLSQDAKDCSSLIDVLASIVERQIITVSQTRRAFGPPGDWGYGTPIGQALQEFYKLERPTTLSKEELSRFEDAFSTHTGNTIRECACGVTYYHPEGEGWETGEIQRLEKDLSAVAVNYSIRGVFIRGNEYADACSCWHPLAASVIEFIEEHQKEIASWFRLKADHLLEQSRQAAGLFPKSRHE